MRIWGCIVYIMTFVTMQCDFSYSLFHWEMLL